MSQFAIYILIRGLKEKRNGRCSQHAEITYSNLLFQFVAQIEIMGHKTYQKRVAQCVPRGRPMNSNVSVLLPLTALQRHFSFFKEPGLSVTLAPGTFVRSPRPRKPRTPLSAERHSGARRWRPHRAATRPKQGSGKRLHFILRVNYSFPRWRPGHGQIKRTPFPERG